MIQGGGQRGFQACVSLHRYDTIRYDRITIIRCLLLKTLTTFNDPSAALSQRRLPTESSVAGYSAFCRLTGFSAQCRMYSRTYLLSYLTIPTVFVYFLKVSDGGMLTCIRN